MGVFVAAAGSRLVTCMCDGCGGVLDLERKSDRSGEIVRVAHFGKPGQMSSLDRRTATKGLVAADWAYKPSLAKAWCQNCAGMPAKRSAQKNYEVGHGKPPVEKRFKAGHSGNPAGRPLGSKNKPQAQLPTVILISEERAPMPQESPTVLQMPVDQAAARATLAQRQLIASKLDEFYDMAKELYARDWSDTKIAAELKFPRIWVTHVRELLYGQHDRNEAASLHALAIAQMEKRAEAMEATFMADMEKHMKAIDSLKKDVAALKGK